MSKRLRTTRSPADTRGRSPQTAFRQPWESSERAARRRRPRHTPQPGTRRPSAWSLAALPGRFADRIDLLLNLRAIDRIAVAGERRLPGGNRVVPPVLFEAQIAEMILDDGVLREPRRRFGQRRVREIELPLLHVGPAQAVEVRRVVGLDVQGP